MPLLSFMWADHELNDISWLRADTFSWQSGSVYTAVYSHLSDDITGKTLRSETISGTTVQFYVADDGHKICPASQESNVTAIYNATGVAWYYIIDTTNQRFKLPRTKFGFTGIRSGAGNYVAAGLPNITGNTHWVGAVLNNNNTSYATGAFSAFDTNTGSYAGGGGYSNAAGRLSFYASRSSSIYGNSSTVQPKATEMYLYFYVGSFKQTALENTAGLNAELFNDKADKNFANTTMIDFVVASQAPTSSNRYTWYRRYNSGWVEQGGITGPVNGTAATISVTLPIVMLNANYSVYVTVTRPGNPDYRDQFLVAGNRSIAGFTVYSNWAGSGNGTKDNLAQWMVCGYKA